MSWSYPVSIAEGLLPIDLAVVATVSIHVEFLEFLAISMRVSQPSVVFYHPHYNRPFGKRTMRVVVAWHE